VDGIGFSGAQLAILAAAFGPLLAAIGVLFRALLASKDEQISLGASALDKQIGINRDLSAAVAEATRELRELRQDLWRKQQPDGGRRD
jgi:uncharacterized protein involved in cysteine biosynthesis